MLQFFYVSSFLDSITGLKYLFVLKFSMNYSPDFLWNLSSVPSCSSPLVRRRIFYLNLLNFKFYKWQKELSSYRSLLYYKHSSFLIDSIKSASSFKSRWGSLSRSLYKNSPPPLFFSYTNDLIRLD